jgi:exodeoxyribonuclease V beta subunit
VHRVFQETDFAAADLEAVLEASIAEASRRRAVEIGDHAKLMAGLRAAIETPLGPVVDGLRLRDVAPSDRLDELQFELPLAGGDEAAGWLTLRDIGAILQEHFAPADPLAGYAQRLEDQALRQRIRGYLTGSLDLVARLPGPRFAIVDYKTNWLAGPDEQLTAWHHRPAALALEMQRHHYGLQALLYVVALHRYLRWRLANYDPDRHLAGVLYLFVRGMSGPATPIVDGQPCGVFAWRPSGALVAALSDTLDRGAHAVSPAGPTEVVG